MRVKSLCPRRLLPALAIMLCGPSGSAWAGAWTQKESEGSAYLQTTATWSSQAFDGDGNLYAAQSYDKVSTQLFLEYGASDQLTLLLAPELLHISLDGSSGDTPVSGSYSGFGYTEFGGRVKLGEGENWIISAQGLARIPGAKPSEGIATAGYVDGESEARILAGLTFPAFGLPGFLDLEMAKRFRYGDAPDEYRLDITLGVRFAPQWVLLLQSFNVVSEGTGDGDFDISYEYYKIQVGGMYDVTDHVSLVLSAVTTWYARNALQENGIVGAVLYRY